MAAAILAAQKPSEVDLEALQRSEAEGILSQFVVQRARLQQQSDLALELGNASGAIAAERAITNNLELVSKLLGMLIQRHEVTRTSILISADYLQLRQVIVQALQPYPEAARAVAHALHTIEVDAAKDIARDSQKPAGALIALLLLPTRGKMAMMAGDLSYALDAVLFARACGLELDPWQAYLLRERPRRSLLLCSRQSAKAQLRH